MREDVRRDLSDSANDFQRVVWPAIQKACGGGSLRPVEAVTSSDFERELDILAGIDAWQITAAGIRGIASRVQWTSRNWRSFTIRKSRRTTSNTEFVKRLMALHQRERGWIFPHLTIQAYLTFPKPGGTLIAVGIVRTQPLYEYAQVHLSDLEVKRNPQDDVEFYVVYWQELRAAGVVTVEISGSSGETSTEMYKGIAVNPKT